MMADEVEPTETTTLNVTCYETRDASEVALVPVTNESTHLPRPLCTTRTTNIDEVMEESDFQRTPVIETVKNVVIVRFDDSYLKTMPGILRFSQVICSLIGLICLTSAGTVDGGYLLLPRSWQFRIYVFISTCAFLTSLSIIFLHVSTLITMFSINWNSFDFWAYSFISFIYMCSTSFIVSTIFYYQKLKSIHHWSMEQLVVSAVIGYLCLFLYGSTALIGLRSWRGMGQFRRYRFANQENEGNPLSNTV